MAVVTGILNEKTRKGLDGVCFQTYGGQTIMRSKPLFYKDANSPLQQAHRQKMKNLGFITKHLLSSKTLALTNVEKQGKILAQCQAFQFLNYSKMPSDVQLDLMNLTDYVNGVICATGNLFNTNFSTGGGGFYEIDLTQGLPYLSDGMQLYVLFLSSDGWAEYKERTITQFDLWIGKIWIANSTWHEGMKVAITCTIKNYEQKIINNSYLTVL